MVEPVFYTERYRAARTAAGAGDQQMSALISCCDLGKSFGACALFSGLSLAVGGG